MMLKFDRNVVCNMDAFFDDIRRFCAAPANIYIFGDGNIASVCYQFLVENNVQIKGVVTTTGDESLWGKKAESIEEFLEGWTYNKKIIIAVAKKWKKDVLYRIGNQIPKENIFFLSDFLYEYLNNRIYLNDLEELASEYPPKRNILPETWNNILVIQIENTIGDMVWGTAFYRELRKNFPNSNISLLVSERLATLVNNCPYFDKVLIYDKPIQIKYNEQSIIHAKSFADEYLVSSHYDVTFIVKQLPSCRWSCFENLLLAIYSKSPIRVGHISYLRDLDKISYEVHKKVCSYIIKDSDINHEVSMNLSLLKVVGCHITNEKMELWPSETDFKFAHTVLNQKRKYVALGIVSNLPMKDWPSEYYRDFVHIMSQVYDDVVFVLLGGENAKQSAHVISESACNVINLVNGTSLSQIAAIMSKCFLYIGSDTGNMHIAAAMGKPIIMISASLPDAFGMDSIAPERVGPWEVPYIVLRPKQGLEGCTRRCMKNYPHCITQITVDEVVKAVNTLISDYAD